MEESTVTSKHQVTIPKRIREEVGIQVGDTLIFESTEDHLLVRRKEYASLAKVLPLDRRAKPVRDVHEWRDIARRRAGKERR